MENITPVTANSALTMHDVWRYELLLVGENSVKVNNIVIALFLALIGIKFSVYVSKALKKTLSRLTTDKDAVNALHKVSFYGFFIFYVITILEIANIPLNMFAFIGGALAISAGLGAKQLLNNLISGILIIIEKPIKIGDMVEVTGIVGRVMSIGGRSTLIKQINGTEIVVPNSLIMQKHLTNWNYSSKNLQIDINIKIDIPSDSNIDIKMLDKITKAAQSVKVFEKLKKLEVSLATVSKNDHEFLLSIEIPENKIKEIKKIKNELNFALIKQIGSGFVIQYPTYLD